MKFDEKLKETKVEFDLGKKRREKKEKKKIYFLIGREKARTGPFVRVGGAERC